MSTPRSRSRRSSIVSLSGAFPLALLLASCAGTPPAPADPVVEVVAPPPPASSAASTGDPGGAPPAVDPDAIVDLINERLRVVTRDGPRQSVELGLAGHVLKRVEEESYEEDFYLRDVREVVYVHEPSWPNPHVARVKLEPGSITRWRRNGEEWTVSTILHVSFVFSSKKAATAVVEAFRELANPEGAD